MRLPLIGRAGVQLACGNGKTLLKTALEEGWGQSPMLSSQHSACGLPGDKCTVNSESTRSGWLLHVPQWRNSGYLKVYFVPLSS